LQATGTSQGVNVLLSNALNQNTACAGSTLALIDPASGSMTRLDTPFTSYSGPTLAVHEVRFLAQA